MELRRPKNCPQCGSSKLAQIIYGRPTAEAMEAAERGEFILGGCFVLPDQPDWECQSCGHQWFDAKDPARIEWEKLMDELENGTLGAEQTN